MRHTGLLRVQEYEPGAWSIQLGAAGRAPASARLSAAEVARLREDLAALLRPPDVVIAGRDHTRTRAEEEAGRVLARIFDARTLAMELGQALSAHPFILAVSADDAAVAALPWELLAAGADGAPLESQGGVVRLVRGGGSAAAPMARARILAWNLCPGDRICQEGARDLERLAGRHQLGFALLEGLDAGIPGPEQGVVDVLHLLCHGEIERASSVLRLDEAGAVAPGTATDLAADLLRRVGLVVLDVCTAGDPALAPISGLAGRILLAGAPACLAPARSAHAEAAAALRGGLYDALARGRPLWEAVAAGRRAVRALARPHPNARPMNALLYVASLEVPLASLVEERPWTPPGWPRPDVELSALLSRMRELALRHGHPHVGLEHLVLAQGPRDGGPVAKAAHKALMTVPRERWASLWADLWSSEARRSDPQATPRLARLLAGASEASVEALWSAIVSDQQNGLHVLVPDLAERVDPARLGERQTRAPRSRSTLGPGAPEPSGPPARGLQLVWGPLDGLELWPQPGAVLGRGAEQGGPDLAIYPVELQVSDDGVSRRHLRWLGEGRFEAPRSVYLQVLASDAFVDQPLRAGELHVGQLLRLSAGTWVRGL